MKALPASLVVALVACGPAVKHDVADHPPSGTFLITAEQIEKTGARTAWQVLKQSAPMLQTSDDRNGRPAKLGRRGRTSFLLDDAPAILLDGVRVPDFRALDDIDAQSIFTIYIYDGIEGTTYYGTNSGSGVIVIKTKAGQS
ncbi:MAG TPA: TonB-dependent receptor plug domain-containing protein [Gemmatimonadales bacterium]|jgi:outer membrane cobalamin receptor